MELSIAEKKQKSFRTMIQNLSREKAEIEDRMASLRQQLAETVRQLDVLRNDMDEIQQEADDLSQKARESQRSWSQHMAADLHAVMLQILVLSLPEPKSTDYSHSIMDKEITEINESEYNEILSCAIAAIENARFKIAKHI